MEAKCTILFHFKISLVEVGIQFLFPSISIIILSAILVCKSSMSSVLISHGALALQVLRLWYWLHTAVNRKLRLWYWLHTAVNRKLRLWYWLHTAVNRKLRLWYWLHTAVNRKLRLWYWLHTAVNRKP